MTLKERAVDAYLNNPLAHVLCDTIAATTGVDREVVVLDALANDRLLDWLEAAQQFQAIKTEAMSMQVYSLFGERP